MVSLVFSIRNLSRIAISKIYIDHTGTDTYVASISGYINITPAKRDNLCPLVD